MAGHMQASFDLLDDLAPTAPAMPLAVRPAGAPTSAASAAVGGQPARRQHPTVAAAVTHDPGAPRSRTELRGDLQAANVATVRFDVQAGDLVRISQFIPAGNQCIGLYPGPLVSVGRGMVRELQFESGVIEWDVASDLPKCIAAASDEAEQDCDMERPLA